MRTITGQIILPSNAPTISAAQLVIEVRDVTMADGPSTVVAQQQIDQVDLNPDGRIAFAFQAPEVAPNRSLSMRVHVDMTGDGRTSPGDLLTTANYPVPNRGTPALMVIRVELI